MKKILLPSLLLLIIIVSCRTTPKTPAADSCNGDKDLRTAIIGNWETNTLLVGIDTLNNSDQSVTLEVNHDEWESRTKQKAPHTIFNSDGTYLSATINDKGKLVYRSAGNWSCEGDTLLLDQQFPSAKKMSYECSVSCTLAEFRATLDFDGDGNSDDLFYCQMRRG